MISDGGQVISDGGHVIIDGGHVIVSMYTQVCRCVSCVSGGGRSVLQLGQWRREECVTTGPVEEGGVCYNWTSGGGRSVL